MTRWIKLPRNARPKDVAPSLRARQLLFEFQSRGHDISVQTDPPRLTIRPEPAADVLPSLVELAYEMRDILREETVWS